MLFDPEPKGREKDFYHREVELREDARDACAGLKAHALFLGVSAQEGEANGDRGNGLQTIRDDLARGGWTKWKISIGD